MARIAIFLACCMLFASHFSSPAVAEKRVALVIGNAAYKHTSELTNPRNDAGDMVAALRALGVEVIDGMDLDKRAMEQKIRAFSSALSDADVGIFFYAGHGLQVGGNNYLVPVDAELSTVASLEFEMVRLDAVQRLMENAVKTNILFLDACRNNPLARNLARAMGTRAAGIGQGLAAAESGVGTLISYSTQPGNVALDGTGRNSPYTEPLVRAIMVPGEDLLSILTNVRNSVLKRTANKQVPWENHALLSKFYFKPDASAAAPGPSVRPAERGDEERLYWDSVKDSKNTRLLQGYLDRYPGGVFAPIAQARIEEIDKPAKQVEAPNPDRAFDEATKIGTSEAYLKFIEAFPDDPRAARLRDNVREDELWQRAQTQDTVQALRTYLAAFPAGIYTARAKQRVAELTAPPPQEPPPRIAARSPIEAAPSDDQYAPGPSMWDHNGSRMKLVADGAKRRFYYEWPRPGMVEEGVRTGTLLFDGAKSGSGYSGTAYVFSRRCGASPYYVSGTISSDERRVTLYGNAPIRLDSRCRPGAHRKDVLVFDLAGG